jgi:hypothetical protein
MLGMSEIFYQYFIPFFVPIKILGCEFSPETLGIID